MLKGCSLYLTGTSARKTAVARVPSRRLPRYRFYDVSAMCSTYSAMAGPDAEVVGLPQLVAKEPLEDVEQLASAVMREVQQFSRSLRRMGRLISQKDFMVMQQGIVVNLDTGTVRRASLAIGRRGRRLATWRKAREGGRDGCAWRGCSRRRRRLGGH